MKYDENLIWERINNARKKPLEEKWLQEIYSPNYSIALQLAITEQIGMLGEQGWHILKSLLQKYGANSELIHGIGLCHQPEAKDWLYNNLYKNNKLNISILNAMECWGASIPTKILSKILKEDSQAIRLSGLRLLEFKVYQLNEEKLLGLTKELLNDFRDPIVIATIKILQKRDGIGICNALAKKVTTSSDKISHYALVALGAIRSNESLKHLLELRDYLPNGKIRDFAIKQIKSQY